MTSSAHRRSCPRCGATFPNNAEYCGIDGELLLRDATDPLVGRTIGRYRITQLVGDGGMSRIYRAFHTFLEQDCALKVLFGELVADDAFASRFRREALAASRLRHPNVVQVIDFGRSTDGLPFIVMEFVRGPTLTRYMRNTPERSVEWIAEMTRQMASGLAAAHRMGFVHRDLKPGNVMLATDDNGNHRAKILDFGLVQLDTPITGDSDNLTRTGQILGSPTYMAPEQISGGELTSRADLYSLGVILYEMIAGRSPFTGEMNRRTKTMAGCVRSKRPSRCAPITIQLLE